MKAGREKKKGTCQSRERRVQRGKKKIAREKKGLFTERRGWLRSEGKSLLEKDRK